MTNPEWPLWSAEHPEEELATPTPQPAADAVSSILTAAQIPPSPEVPAEGNHGLTCPECGRPVHPAASFCEGCGARLSPTEAPPPTAVPAAGQGSTQTRRLGVRASQVFACPSCGGTVSADGYCQTCGAKAPSPRDHFTEAPAPWVGGVCDRGIQHYRNEDAMALWAEGDRAVLVVCDGVSTSIDSDVAAMAAAERARDVLVHRSSDGLDLPESRDAAMALALVEATAEANEAVVSGTANDSTNAASATMAAAVVSGDLVHYANLGDSRVYFIGAGERLLLTLDDSMAQAFIAEGMPRTEAEALPRAHAITKWLGRDAVDIVPRTGVHRISEPGWLVVCSDGLWNYASAPDELAGQLAAAASGTSDPVILAQRLVDWANSRGGHDNITVALAKCGASLSSTPSTEPGREKPPNG